jgi:uncharacterized protein YkwD
MKNLFLFLVIFLSNFVICQTSYHMTKKDFDFMDSIKTTYNKDSVEKEFIILLNKYRKEKGLDSVKFSQVATNAAKYQTDYCYKNNILVHTTPNLGYENLDNRLKSFGVKNYDTKRRGECGLSLSTVEMCPGQVGFSEGILNKWKNSPKHNSILLHKDVKEIGIHITKGERGPLYCFIILIE